MSKINPDAECNCRLAYKEHFFSGGIAYCNVGLPEVFTPVPAPSKDELMNALKCTEQKNNADERKHYVTSEAMLVKAGGDQKAMREPHAMIGVQVNTVAKLLAQLDEKDKEIQELRALLKALAHDYRFHSCNGVETPALYRAESALLKSEP